MSRYRTIHCLIWNDDRFPFASDKCQLVFFHVMTTPLSTPFGLYKASLEALAAEKRWPVKAYREGFREAFRQGFVKHDERVHVVYIPNFLKYNPPNNPNVLKSWAKCYEEIPNCALKDEFFLKLKAFAEGFQKGFDKAFAEGFAKPLPIQEQEQEQYQEQKRGTRARPKTRAHPKTRARATPMPVDFQITPDMRAWFERTIDAELVPLERGTEKWQNSMLSSQRCYSDWKAAWRNGMLRAEEWARERLPVVVSNGANPRCPPHNVRRNFSDDWICKDCHTTFTEALYATMRTQGAIR